MKEDNIQQNSIKAWVLAARPKTLSGAAVPVIIGLALAFTDAKLYQGEAFNWTAAILCLLFAFVMQIDANFINDFFDYVKGNDDTSTRLGPLRACTQGWISIHAMRHAIASTTVLACAIGLPLIYYGGLEMIAIGLLCVIFCFLYTTHLSYLGLGDILVLVFFGIVPVSITYYVQLHTVTAEVMTASIACGMVVDALLIVNNYRDRDNDSKAGKKTLVVRIGSDNTEQLYLSLGIVASLCGIVYWMNGHILAAILPLIYLILHKFTYIKMKKIHEGKQLNECLGETARNILVFGICMALGFLL